MPLAELPMHVLAMTVIASLGGLLFGYDTGVISGALLFIRAVFHLSPTMQGVVAGLALAGAAAGAAAGGSLADRFGRRSVILVTAGIFIAGSLVSALAPGVASLLAGRVLVGLAIGVSSMLTPLYLAEIALARNRGAMVSLNQLCVTLGILVSYLVGYALAHTAEGWRWMLGLGTVPGVMLLSGMALLPESPRWLAGHGEGPAAEAALRRLRGPGDIGPELAALRTDLRGEQGRAAPWAALLDPGVRRPMIVGIGLAVFQQATGINTVIYFAPTIFQSAGLSSASASILATAGVGLVNVLLTIAAMLLVDRVGRRALLLSGLAGMAVMLAGLAAAFGFGAHGGVGWIALGSVAAYVGFFAIGLGPVFWLLISEIFPLRIRARAMGVSTVANWGANLVVTITFLDLVGLLGQSGTFLLYAAMSVGATLFAARFVPETNGRSLEEIEATMQHA